MENQLSTFIFEPKEFVVFETAWDWQKKWQHNLLTKKGFAQAVWLLQHHPCYTLGRGATEKNLLFEPSDSNYSVHRIDRGGEVTYHVPGQLVVYLVFDLNRYQKDLNWYLRQLENVVVDVLDHFGLSAELMKGITGVWCHGLKVASIGVGCRRWVTQHGFALNVDCSLSGFDHIVPCGLTDHSVGRLSSWLPGITVEDVKPVVRKSLIERFGLIFSD